MFMNQYSQNLVVSYSMKADVISVIMFSLCHCKMIIVMFMDPNKNTHTYMLSYNDQCSGTI